MSAKYQQLASILKSELQELHRQGITSLGHKQSRTGKTAAGLVLELLEGKPPRSLCLEWELSCRASA